MGNSYSLTLPQQIHYGNDSFEQLGSIAKLYGTRVLLISDKIIEEVGYVEKCKNQFEKNSLTCEVFLGVDSEPNNHYVEEALKLFEEVEFDVIVSIGGGSCIDTAKAVSVLATNQGDISEYMNQKRIATNHPVPHIAIPTTAGTGSEATDVTVITNIDNEEKMMIKQFAFLPTVAIVDPKLTKSAPKSVTAATGLDALCHAIESYISKLRHPMTDMLAISAIELIVNNLQAVYENGDNMEAREKVSLGSLQAGMAFSNASVTLVHGLSRPIGALFNVPHGISNAMLLPAVLEYSMNDCVDRLADVGRLFAKEKANKMSNEEAAIYAVKEIKLLCSKLDIPNLQGWGIEESAFMQSLDKMAEDAERSGSPANNPKVPTKEEMIELYKTCYYYQFNS